MNQNREGHERGKKIGSPGGGLGSQHGIPLGGTLVSPREVDPNGHRDYPGERWTDGQPWEAVVGARGQGRLPCPRGIGELRVSRRMKHWNGIRSWVPLGTLG